MALAPDPSILRGAEMFAGLSDAELREVLDAGRIRRLPAGTQAFAQGDPGVSCHSLLHGRVKIVQTRPDGSQHVIRFIDDDDPISMMTAHGAEHHQVIEAFGALRFIAEIVGKARENGTSSGLSRERAGKFGFSRAGLAKQQNADRLFGGQDLERHAPQRIDVLKVVP